MTYLAVADVWPLSTALFSIVLGLFFGLKRVENISQILVLTEICQWVVKFAKSFIFKNFFISYCSKKNRRQLVRTHFSVILLLIAFAVAALRNWQIWNPMENLFKVRNQINYKCEYIYFSSLTVLSKNVRQPKLMPYRKTTKQID